MVSDATAIRNEAESAARSLADGLPRVEAILLFGSVARGNPSDGSDIDLMAVSSEPLNGPSTRAHLSDWPSVSLVSHTWESLEQASADDWSFFVHLREEGELVYGDGRLPELLGTVGRPSGDLWRKPLFDELKGLSRFDDLSIFDDHFLFALGHLFITGRRTCMLDNTAAGEIAFERDQAFEVFGRRHPELAEETACLRAIWPFQARMQGRLTDLPFAIDDVGRVEEALACTRRIVCSAIDA